MIKTKMLCDLVYDHVIPIFTILMRNHYNRYAPKFEHIKISMSINKTKEPTLKITDIDITLSNYL